MTRDSNIFGFIFLFFFLSNSYCQTTSRTIKGVISDGDFPISNAYIRIKGTELVAISGSNGVYEITASEGDILVYSHVGMEPVEVLVQDITQTLNIELLPAVNELDEVVLKSSKRRKKKIDFEEYDKKKTIIRTAYGYLDKTSAGGTMRIINREDILDINLCILDLLRGKFSGITVKGDCLTGGAVSIRGAGSISNAGSVLYDIDGQLFSEAPIWLPIQNIRRVAVLSSYSLTTMYGTLGRGGVVVINTVGNNPSFSASNIAVQNLNKDIYTDNALDKESLLDNYPSFYKELEDASSEEQFTTLLKDFEVTFSNSPYFYLDAFSLYVEKWNNIEAAEAVVRSKYPLISKNPVLLKAYAYKLEALNLFAKANEVYKEVFLLRPEYVQSYLDLINNYQDLGNYKQAKGLLLRMTALLEKRILKCSSPDLDDIMKHELISLASLSNENLDLSIQENQSNFDLGDTRVVFEWNDNEAEFNVQFVNPNNQFSTWNHSYYSEKDQIGLEKECGYNQRDFFIDRSLSGTWKFNIEYLGNKSLTPTYLKVTVYSDFGKPSQSKSVTVYKLFLKNKNHELFYLNI